MGNSKGYYSKPLYKVDNMEKTHMHTQKAKRMFMQSTQRKLYESFLFAIPVNVVR